MKTSLPQDMPAAPFHWIVLQARTQDIKRKSFEIYFRHNTNGETREDAAIRMANRKFWAEFIRNSIMQIW